MSDDTREYRYYRFAHEADSFIDRVRGYLSRRTAADWGFFIAGIVIGAILF
jgi:hypothetical protein